MNNNNLIEVTRVSKRFCRNLKRSLWYGVRDIASEISGKTAGSRSNLRAGEFWAINNVSLKVRRGECLGLIGPNGSGKSTLLRMLNGLLKPESGRIVMRGRVAALINLGAGFNPILTGRENIFINGAVLGISKHEMRRRIDEIIEFADIYEAIDAPVMSYSSGMRVRLGFAVAAHLDPDVLLLDEVLAVGDAAFRDKCYRHIVALRKKASVIFVSHTMEQISRVCDEVLILESGRNIFKGLACEGISQYEALNSHKGDKEDGFLSLGSSISSFTAKFCNTELGCGSSLTITITVLSCERVEDFILRIIFYNAAGAFAADRDLSSHDYGVVLSEGESVWQVHLDSVPLRHGRYRAAFNIIDKHGDLIVWSYKQYDLRIIDDNPVALADCQLQPKHWKSQTGNGEAYAHDK